MRCMVHVSRNKLLQKGQVHISVVTWCNFMIFVWINLGSLFLRMTCHLKCFKTANKTTYKMHDFILDSHSHNTKFYVVSLVIYGISPK
jgi:hypothetical protein